MSKQHSSQQDHKHATPHRTSRKKLHHTLLFIVAVGLMLAGMVMYVISNDEADPPGGAQPGVEMPADAGP